MAGIVSHTNLFSSSSSPTHLLSGSDSPPKSASFLKVQPLKSSSDSGFYGCRICLDPSERKIIRGAIQPMPVQMTLCIPKTQRWWQKGTQPNMKEVTSAQGLYGSLLKAGDKLVIVDFFSPGCGGCKALHPKICQFAEMNPDIQFLQVNYEDHKSMCYSLNVHVLPFFRFYRGAHGRLCSFSCTNATIKKFRDALAKHTTERCSVGPTKGLEESELLALAANKELNFTYTPKPTTTPVEEPAPAKIHVPLPLTPSMPFKESEERTLATSGI